MNGPPKELSELRTVVFAAIDKNRNTRQKTTLLTYASGIIRDQSQVVRDQLHGVRMERRQVSGSLNNSRTRLHRQLEAASEPEPGEKKPVQSIRTIPSA